MRCPHCGEIDWTRAPELRDTLRYAIERRVDFTARDIAQHFGLSISNASNRCRTLADLEFTVGERRGNREGGIHYVYRVTALGRKAGASIPHPGDEE